ncbi:coproporphyrinogen III oxidase [Paenibacillus thermotolerans]|uniref:coproporphyrinogen III oxidase n=1 Tax=Paenibacillus thermotolerans TaxID=3027807 RepID=UPI002368D9B6|nr:MULTISPECIES: coproporphyrinogen III oxidase [unclassified Paenibacillus]
MNIRIERVGFAEFDIELFHLSKLFYDEVEIEIRDEENAVKSTVDPDLTVRLELQIDDAAEEMRLQSTLFPKEGEPWSERFRRPIKGRLGDERKKAVKRTVGIGLLKALEHATGLSQPWGTLTGVRPTKLMHNMLLELEHDAETAKRILQEEYFVTKEKAELLTEVAERQLKVIPDLHRINEKEVSVYIGIPFCPTKCAYCTFPAYDIRGNNGSVDGFLEGLHYEIRETGRWLKEAGLAVTTIYWGGGTPTSIEADQIDALFFTLHESFPGMENVRELTVEAGRPDTITPEKLQVLKKWRVDRISINPQSFTQATLDTIGRHHTVEETVDKFLLSREMGMTNINMDLIIGLPNEGMKEFRHTLNQVERLMPESLTVHTLSFKRASKMTKNRENYEVAERNEIRAMMEAAISWTQQHRYVPYYLYRQKNILGNLENVGYSFEGKESLYNILMMEERQTVIGLGCGAVSKVVFPHTERIERMPNPKEPFHYNQAYKEYTAKKLALLSEAYGAARANVL